MKINLHSIEEQKKSYCKIAASLTKWEGNGCYQNIQFELQARRLMLLKNSFKQNPLLGIDGLSASRCNTVIQ